MGTGYPWENQAVVPEEAAPGVSLRSSATCSAGWLPASYHAWDTAGGWGLQGRGPLSVRVYGRGYPAKPQEATPRLWGSEKSEGAPGRRARDSPWGRSPALHGPRQLSLQLRDTVRPARPVTAVLLHQWGDERMNPHSLSLPESRGDHAGPTLQTP